MIVDVQLSNKKVYDQKTDCFVYLLPEGFSPTLFAPYKNLYGIDVSQIVSRHAFKGSRLETFSMPLMHKNTLHHLILVGLGKSEKKRIDVEMMRRAMAHAYRKAVVHKAQTCAVQLPPASLFGLKPESYGKQLATIINMAAYRFDEYISDKDRKEKALSRVTLCVSQADLTSFKKGVKAGHIIAEAVNTTREWIDRPPKDLTPPELTRKAKAIAKKTGLKITVFTENQIKKMGMGGLAGVSSGSDLDCQLVILEYKTKKKHAPTIAFVGKGITFDSGGLSLKPADYMENMKDDMSGAAAVINSMEAIAQLKPDVNVIGVTPLSENLPSGKALKPGDIVTFYNGKTAEVRNTDAEGRLVLADALAYTTKHYKPDAIIDVATLTGACQYALGPFYSGMMSQHDALVKQVEAAAERSGDRVWRLPLHDDYKPAIRSSIADIQNIGSRKYMAGTITAAHFLKNFVGDTPWVHLDIAGTAFDVPDMPYYRPGATGAAVRLLIDLALNYNN